MSGPPNKAHLTRREGAPGFVRRRPVVDARLAGEAVFDGCGAASEGHRPFMGESNPTGIPAFVGRALRMWPPLLLLLLAAGGRAAELRPTLSAGYAHNVGGHASLSGAVRVQIVSAFFVQAEYLALRGDRHTEHGPTLLACWARAPANSSLSALACRDEPAGKWRSDSTPSSGSALNHPLALGCRRPRREALTQGRAARSGGLLSRRRGD